MQVLLLFSFLFALNSFSSEVLKDENFEKPSVCGKSCHIDIYKQWQNALMSQAYTHHWDEIEYFKWHFHIRKKEPKVAPGKATVKATLYYQKLPQQVAEFLQVPLEEAKPIEVNFHSININILK